MSEQPNIGGLPPNFNLQDMLNRGEPVGEFDLPYAAAAANRLFEATQTDVKTGLLKQETFMANLQHDVANLSPDSSIDLYVADLDGFKAVNDRLGHSAGDELLGVVAQAFRDSFKRGTDVISHGSREQPKDATIARLGGDEFAVYNVNTITEGQNRSSGDEASRVQTARVNQHLQELIADSQFSGFDLRLSIGHATYEPGNTADELFARADHDMFAVKYSGKIDRITDDDRAQLEVIIPYLEGLGVRVESWLKEAIREP